MNAYLGLSSATMLVLLQFLQLGASVTVGYDSKGVSFDREVQPTHQPTKTDSIQSNLPGLVSF